MLHLEHLRQQSRLPWFLAILFLMGLSLLPALPQAGAQDISYATYVNARFAYSIKYPPQILIPQGEAANGDGQRFVSPDGRAVLTVWGSHNALGETLEDSFRQAFRESGRVTYQARKGNWFVVSGYRGGAIVYQKTYLLNDVFKTFTLEYPEDQRGLFDRVTAMIAASFTGR